MEDEWYMLANRSSGPKNGLVMANGIGIIDSGFGSTNKKDVL